MLFAKGGSNFTKILYTASVCIIVIFVLFHFSNKLFKTVDIFFYRIAKRMALLVFTDFICWFPIALFALTSCFGVHLISLEQVKNFFLSF